VLKLRKLEAIFFRTAPGREPVREWLRSLPKHERQTIGEDIAYVQYRWPLCRPHVDHLRSGIWEIRSSLDNRIARILFGLSGNDEIVLLHGFIEKTRVTPAGELEIAERRWREWQEEERGRE
jgi:phage-related protein